MYVNYKNVDENQATPQLLVLFLMSSIMCFKTYVYLHYSNREDSKFCPCLSLMLKFSFLRDCNSHYLALEKPLAKKAYSNYQEKRKVFVSLVLRNQTKAFLGFDAG